MKRFFWALLTVVAIASMGCPTPPVNTDAGMGGGSGGGAMGGGGGATGGGGGTGGGGDTGGGGGSGGGGATGGGGGATAEVRPAKDIVAGSGRISGGNFVMDAQVGQGTPQAPATGGNRVIQGNTAIKR